VFHFWGNDCTFLQDLPFVSVLSFQKFCSKGVFWALVFGSSLVISFYSWCGDGVVVAMVESGANDVARGDLIMVLLFCSLALNLILVSWMCLSAASRSPPNQKLKVAVRC